MAGIVYLFIHHLLQEFIESHLIIHLLVILQFFKFHPQHPEVIRKYIIIEFFLKIFILFLVKIYLLATIRMKIHSTFFNHNFS